MVLNTQILAHRDHTAVTKEPIRCLIFGHRHSCLAASGRFNAGVAEEKRQVLITLNRVFSYLTLIRDLSHRKCM